MPKSVGIRMDDELLRKLDEMSEDENMDRSTLVRRLLRKGYRLRKKERAAERYKKGEITLSEAADIADVPVGDMMDELTERGLKSGIDEEDLKDCLENARRAIKG